MLLRLGLLVVFGGILAIILAVGFDESHRVAHLVEVGVRRVAQIERKHDIPHFRRVDDHCVDVVFDVEGALVHAHREVSLEQFDALSEGHSLEVTFDPADPTSILFGPATSEESARLARWTTIAVCGLAAVFAFLAWLCLLVPHRALRLLRSGEPFRARVIEVIDRTVRGTPLRSVVWEVDASEGVVLRSADTVRATRAREIRTGDLLTVLVDRRHRGRRSALFALLAYGRPV